MNMSRLPHAKNVNKISVSFLTLEFEIGTVRQINRNGRDVQVYESDP